MKEKQVEKDISSIRHLMERSSRFISLSGLSGILAGTYALIGIAIVHHILYDDYNIFQYRDYFDAEREGGMQILLTALIVLLASLASGAWLSFRNAKRKAQPVYGPTTRLLIENLAIPLAAGGIFILIIINNGYYGMAAPACLIFYGIAMVSGSNFTFGDVKWLGIFEIAAGLLAALLPGYGLLLWAFGFGIMHILYGVIMYYKYER